MTEAYIKQLKNDKANILINPKTVADAVIDSDGKTTQDRIDEGVYIDEIVGESVPAEPWVTPDMLVPSFATLYGNWVDIVNGSYKTVPLSSSLSSPSAGYSIMVGNISFDSSNNSIKIGDGIKYVKVSGQLRVQSPTAEKNYWAVIGKNNATDSVNNRNISKMITAVTNADLAITLSPVIVQVNKGDYFNLAVYGNGTGRVINNNGDTFLTVEAIG